MTVLLYFVSFASIAVLFTSTIALALWALWTLLDGFVRVYLAIMQPEIKPAKKRSSGYSLDHLKRAGQW